MQVVVPISVFFCVACSTSHIFAELTNINASLIEITLVTGTLLEKIQVGKFCV